MTQPTFSVIIPAYNAAHTLRATVESVLEQTISDFEIVIVDDGSTDDTRLVMLELAGGDTRIRAVSKKNEGVSATRNYAASLARGKLLAFLDADDSWSPDKLAQHADLHARYPYLVGSFARVRFCSDGLGRSASRVTSQTFAKTYLSLDDVIVENAVCTMSNLVIERKAFHEYGGFDEELRYAEDQEFLIRLMAEGRLIKAIDAVLTNYCLSEDGLSCDFESMLSGWRSFVERRLHQSELANAEANYCRYLARRALRSGAEMHVVRSFARRGLAADRNGFLRNARSGVLTLGGAIVGGSMPRSVRRAVFA